MHRLISLICFCLAVTISGSALAEKKSTNDRDRDGKSRKNEIVISGKVFCPVKRQLILPFRGTILSMDARPGEQVKAGQVLARYRLEPEESLKLQKRVSSFRVDDLEMQLAETEKNLAQLKEKQQEIQQLSKQDMAPSNSLIRVEREIGLLEKKKELLQKRVPLEQSFADKDLAIVEDLLGEKVLQGHAPDEGRLIAPIGCHVIWVNPDLSADAEFRGGTAAFSIGVLDPMVIRAQVHEIEAMQLKVGDTAEFSLESIPDRKFSARLSAISWTSMTPQPDRPSYYEVELEVPNPEFILRDGLRGKITFR